ncbi:LmeA family phospholipid-binding protein [Phormidium sp. CCY1219]|uniref:LmeA family phospholipid-binding protein n=1 Tax=Phormidium sp. CCY1219 TaxID=2886104 RepID=UPI002D1F8EB1|nr:DUF2993 domain-containing protein [Phormidium sp. CCY1219]MEB3826352.1 DUF2993 domain-containing protein [Phormidium sp. CCY1219]
MSARSPGPRVSPGTERPPSPPESGKPRQLIGRVLSKAVELWLRSQVEAIDTLQVTVTADDRQLLQGSIPQVFIRASGALYQGLHLSHIELCCRCIRVNLSQVLRGKPLRLLEPLPATVRLELTEADLNASLQAPLLANALSELLRPLLGAENLENSGALQWHRAQMHCDVQTLTLTGCCPSEGNRADPFLLRMGLELASPHQLHFVNPSIQRTATAAIAPLESFTLELGSQVAIEQFIWTPGQWECGGRLTVMP